MTTVKALIKENANEGNGLTNMKKRAEEIKADLTIYSTAGKGTQISLILKSPELVI